MANKKIALVVILIFSLFLGRTTQALATESLTIFSEANMTYALTKIARIYSQKNNVAISINFRSSFELIEDIDLGEPADIFISSHLDWVRNLSQKGLVDRSNSLKFATDNLVLVTSKNNKKINLNEVKNPSDLNEILRLISAKKVPLIIGSDYSSLGRYTKQIVDESKVSNFQIFQKLNEDKKSIIDLIDEHNEYCGIVMKSEITNNSQMVVLASVPQVEIDYHALVIAGDNMENARKFVEYLKSDEAKAILLGDGFGSKQSQLTQL